MSKFKKAFLYFIQFFLIPVLAYAAGSAYPANYNQTAVPLAGVNSAGEMVVVRTDDDGNLLMSCTP